MKYVFTMLLATTALLIPAVLANPANAQSNDQLTNPSANTGMTSGMASDSTSATNSTMMAAPAGVLSESNIRDIQQSLNSEGYYSGSIDGVWGPGTVASLRQFQLDNGLASDGRLTGRTLDTLGVELSAADSARIRASGGLLANEPVGSGVAAGSVSGTASTSPSGTMSGPTGTPGASTMSTPGSSTMSTPGASTMGGNMGSQSSGSAAGGSSSN